jgi:hypothetical protein
MLRKGLVGTRGWVRAVALMLAAGALSVLNPVILISVPFALLALFTVPPRVVPVFAGGVATALAFGGVPGSGLWYLERGWALILGGWFLAITLRWPKGSLTSRALGAVAGSFVAMALLFWTRPGEWAVVQWAVSSRMESGMALAIQAMKGQFGPEVVTPSFEARALDAMAFQGTIFPALLGLASLAALGAAWWLNLRLRRVREEGIGPLGGFRFNDQLVWVLILGLGFLVGASGVPDDVGVNAVVFMGALYALRGAGVVLFLTGGPTFFGAVLLLLGVVFVAPLVLAAAFVIGLGDTWLDLRTRSGAETSS